MRNTAEALQTLEVQGLTYAYPPAAAADEAGDAEAPPAYANEDA